MLWCGVIISFIVPLSLASPNTCMMTRYTLVYSEELGVSYCPIAKVASSTWCGHFVRLGRSDLAFYHPDGSLAVVLVVVVKYFDPGANL